MPPKQQFSKDDIIEASFELVREDGFENLSARAVAKKLNSSTRPLYDHFQSMKDLEEELVKKVMAFFVESVSQDRTGDKWLDQALGYVLFAQQEKQLFRFVNHEKYIGYQKKFGRIHWKELGDQLQGDERFDDIPDAARERIRMIRWFTVHGLAVLLNGGWYETDEKNDLSVEGKKKIQLKTLLEEINDGMLNAFLQ